MRSALGSLATQLARRPTCVSISLRSQTAVCVSKRGYADDRQPQALQDYEDDLLDAPLHSVQPGTRIAPAVPPPEELPKTEREEQLAKARVVFGSRLAGPVERREALDRASQMVAGVLVPPKPAEPDNCCMSGCVNCVWDLYRDEMEEWAAKSAEARQKMTAQRTSGQGTGTMASGSGTPSHVAVSMDDDGGGSETNWAGEESFGEGNVDLFSSVPVGIREFMKTEKKLKERHIKEQSIGG